MKNMKANFFYLVLMVFLGCQLWPCQKTDSHAEIALDKNLIRVLSNISNNNYSLDKTFLIKVNLSKILGKYNPEDFIYNVANGSMKQDKSLNPNGLVIIK